MAWKVIIELKPMGEAEASPLLEDAEKELRKYEGFVQGHSERNPKKNISLYIAEFRDYPDGILDLMRMKPHYEGIRVLAP